MPPSAAQRPLLDWDGRLTLVLASASPQRAAILRQLGVDFDARPTAVAELDHGDPRAVASENARRKAAAGRAALAEDERGSHVVLACDTIVALGGEVFGKPADASAARAVITRLAGETHEVLGAIALALPDGRTLEGTGVTRVRFAALDERQVAAYVASGEWRDRAGGYAIQLRGAAIVESIEGDYLNVVGLPVGVLRALVQGLVQPF